MLPALNGELGDAFHELWIRNAVRRGRGRELALLLEIAARVDLDDVDLAGLGKPQVDAAVVAYAQRAIRVDRGPLQLGFELGLDFRDHGLRAVKTITRLVELRAAVHDLEAAFLEPREIHLDRRERDELAIAHDADVELPPLDVLLSERGVAEGALD